MTAASAAASGTRNQIIHSFSDSQAVFRWASRLSHESPQISISIIFARGRWHDSVLISTRLRISLLFRSLDPAR